MFLLTVLDSTLKKLKIQSANLLTFLNLFLGGFAVIESIKGNGSLSLLLIFVAAFIDRFDGIVARKLQIESDFGKQLDSMSDIISFGVAPALLIYQGILFEFDFPGIFFTILYIACGAFRLARFNISENQSFFTGLPITAAGCFLTFSYLFLPILSPAVFLFLIIILSFLMVSPFKLKKI